MSSSEEQDPGQERHVRLLRPNGPADVAALQPLRQPTFAAVAFSDRYSCNDESESGDSDAGSSATDDPRKGQVRGQVDNIDEQ